LDCCNDRPHRHHAPAWASTASDTIAVGMLSPLASRGGILGPLATRSGYWPSGPPPSRVLVMHHDFAAPPTGVLAGMSPNVVDPGHTWATFDNWGSPSGDPVVSGGYCANSGSGRTSQASVQCAAPITAWEWLVEFPDVSNRHDLFAPLTPKYPAVDLTMPGPNYLFLRRGHTTDRFAVVVDGIAVIDLPPTLLHIATQHLIRLEYDVGATTWSLLLDGAPQGDAVAPLPDMGGLEANVGIRLTDLASPLCRVHDIKAWVDA